MQITLGSGYYSTGGRDYEWPVLSLFRLFLPSFLFVFVCANNFGNLILISLLEQRGRHWQIQVLRSEGIWLLFLTLGCFKSVISSSVTDFLYITRWQASKASQGSKRLSTFSVRSLRFHWSYSSLRLQEAVVFVVGGGTYAEVQVLENLIDLSELLTDFYLIRIFRICEITLLRVVAVHLLRRRRLRLPAPLHPAQSVLLRLILQYLFFIIIIIFFFFFFLVYACSEFLEPEQFLAQLAGACLQTWIWIF